MTIRRFNEADAKEVSDLIIRTIRISNMKDYPADMMEDLIKHQQPEDILERAGRTHFYVAEINSVIAGCGAISQIPDKEDQSSLSTVFVLPEFQGSGIGRRIIEALEEDEYAARSNRIELHASITGLGFYRKLGYSFKDGNSGLDEDLLYTLEKYPGEMHNLKIRKLAIKEAQQIYDRHLVKDFPRDEVKPFEMIRRSMEAGRYAAYGAYLQDPAEDGMTELPVREGGRSDCKDRADCRDRAEDVLAGYAFLAAAERENETISLLDYFAVTASRRGKGIGTAVLQRLSPAELNCRCILIEAERVKDSLSVKEKMIREKRIHFYENAGAVRTGVFTYLYGVEYEILLLNHSAEQVSKEEAYELTDFMYREMYDASWFPRLAGFSTE